MREHTREPIAHRVVDRIKGFRQCADLIHLDEHGVCTPLGYTALDVFFVGHKQVIANELNFVTDTLVSLAHPSQSFSASPSSSERIG